MPFRSIFHSKQEALCQQPSEKQKKWKPNPDSGYSKQCNTSGKKYDKCNILTLAAPVLLGMMLNEAALPPLQSLADGPSTVFWVADLQSNNKKMN